MRSTTSRCRVGAVVALWGLSACGGDADAPPPAGATAADSVAAVPTPGPVRTAGVFVLGEGTVEFRPCDGGEPLWLDGPLVPDLVELHGELAPGVEPFEGVFVDLVGHLGPGPAMGSGIAYSGSLIPLRVRRAAYEGWNCGDDDPAVVVEVRGTEPFWTLRVTDQEVDFATPEGRRTLEMGPLSDDAEGWVLQGTDADGSNVFVSLTPIPCRDAMSGAYSHLSAEVEIGGRRLQGCAYLGPTADPDAGQPG